MSIIKILHTADVHLDSPLRTLALRNPELREKVQAASRSAFKKITQTCIDEEVSALLISGDLFDGVQRSIRTVVFLLGELNRLKEKNIDVFYIKGNHDAENSNVGTIVFPSNIHVFDGSGGRKQLSNTNIFIHGVSYLGKKSVENLIPKFKDPIPDSINIGMLHTSLAGSNGHDVYAPCSLTELIDFGFDYWALGHIHKREIYSKKPFIVMPGIPQGRDIGESGPKSATMIEINDKIISISEVQTSTIEFQKLQINIEDTEDDDDLTILIESNLTEVSQSIKSEDIVLRVEFIGTVNPNRYWTILNNKEIWEETINKITETHKNLWLDKFELQIICSTNNLVSSETALDEIEKILGNIQNDSGVKELISDAFETIKGEIPRSRRAMLFQDEKSEDVFKKNLLDEGIKQVLAGMKGGEL